MTAAQRAVTIAADSAAPPQAATAERKPRISKRLRETLRLLLSGECKTQRAACARTGMNEQYLSGALRKPEIRVFIERESRQTIAAGTMRASARLVELIDASSEHVSADVSKHFLAIAGIKPAVDAQVSVNIDIKAGYVIDLSEDRKPIVDVTPAVSSDDDYPALAKSTR